MTETVKGAASQGGGAQEAAAPKGALQSSLQQLTGTVTNRAVSSLSDRLGSTTERLTDYAESGGGKGLLSAVTGLEDVTSPVKSVVKKGLGNAGEKVKDTLGDAAGSLFGGKGGGGKKIKVTNIVEHIDVGAPVELVYRQWTEFAEFPKYMKKVEQVEQVSDEKLTWKAQVFWSHRSWESTIIEQVPNDRIVWRSKGDKGYVDGAITFHELAPNLTRVIVVLEYHPQGLFEHTGNLWRAQGRRVRLELKHFQRQLMTQTLLHPDDVQGWPGEIRDGEVVDAEGDEADEAESPEDETEDTEEPEDTASDDEPDGGGAPRRRTSRLGRGRAGARARAAQDEDADRPRPARKAGSRS